jgi:hypothetical protein
MDNIYLESRNDGRLLAYLKREGFTVKGGKGWAEDILAEWVWIGTFNSDKTKYFPNTGGRKNPIRNSAMLFPLSINEFIESERMYALIKGN